MTTANNGAGQLSQDELAIRADALDALDTEQESIKTPKMYRLSLIPAVLVIVAIPLIYLVAIAGVAWGVYWYAIYGGEILWTGSSVVYVVVRFGPPIVGTILIFFLLKPVLARPSEVTKPHILVRDSHPFLFDFVERLCAQVGAPVPHRIVVNLDVNASASFAYGLSSLFSGKLALSIGLPLVSTMRLREFTGVLAHELGHFSQGAGMRFYYLTAMMNQWFQRVVYERDSWDEWLARWSLQGTWMNIVVLRGGSGKLNRVDKWNFCLNAA